MPPRHLGTVIAPASDRCVYCGAVFPSGKAKTKDHVPPKGLYAKEVKLRQGFQQVTVPSCVRCNNVTSEDEVKFRNVLLMAGPTPNEARTLNFKTLLRSFEHTDGGAQWEHMMRAIKREVVDGTGQSKIYPAHHPQVLAVVRKIVRGLCYLHDVAWPVLDSDVLAKLWIYQIPEVFHDYFEAGLGWYHVEPDIFEYRFDVMTGDADWSWWYVTFYQTVSFMVIVGNKEI